MGTIKDMAIQANIISPKIRPASPSLADEGSHGQTVIARDVPTLNGINSVIVPTSHSFDLGGEFHRKPLQRIYNSRSAPSAISSENYLAARALISQAFVHNIAITKQARISNLYKDAPEFRDQIDILA